MRVFLTGATGYIGSAAARALLAAGHEVVGLTHSPEKARRLKAAGVHPFLGDMTRPESYRAAAASCHALIHLGFEYGPPAADSDRMALETLSAAAARTGALLVYTSGVWVLGPWAGAPADEDDVPRPLDLVAWRPAHERLALDAGGVVLRPGCVYGERGGLYGRMLLAAVEEHEIRLAGDGANAWASVYLDDLAELYRLVVEKRPHGIYHATDGSAEPLRDVAEAFLEAAGGGAVTCLDPAQAAGEWGPFASALALDQRVSSAKARRELGWEPAVTSVGGNASLLLAQWHAQAGPLSVS